MMNSCFIQFYLNEVIEFSLVITHTIEYQRNFLEFVDMAKFTDFEIELVALIFQTLSNLLIWSFVYAPVVFFALNVALGTYRFQLECDFSSTRLIVVCLA